LKKVTTLLSCILIYTVGFAQQTSAYIQSQFQYGEESASLKVGGPNENKEDPYSRFGIRRGRIKFTYKEGIASAVFQIDITEKGFDYKDIYINLKDPWSGSNSLCVGLFNRPFGYEIECSSSKRESPERSKIFCTLFPGERDLGGMITLKPTNSSLYHSIKIKAGLFAGNGPKKEIDNKKDFIGHLIVNSNIGNNINLGIGFSYYYGGVYQGSENVYSMHNKSFVLNRDNSNIGKFAKREYFGIDGQLYIKSKLGNSSLKGEFLLGTQPGCEQNSISPNSSTLPAHDTYIRNFNGGYIMYVQEIGKLPVSAVVKYDCYNPNIKVSKNDIGLNGTGEGDIKYSTIGAGLLFKVNKCIRLQAYYQWISNEKSKYLVHFNEDIKDNLFTLRLQYKFK